MLGILEIKQPVQGIPVASIVLPSSPLSWSDDNNLALATQLGLYIFELHMSPHENHPVLMFDRVFFPPPEAPHPFILTGPPLQDLMHPLDTYEAHSIMLDANLTSAHRAYNEIRMRRSQSSHSVSANTGGDPNHCGFSKAIWSSKGMDEGNGCLLLLLTYDYQISLVGQVGARWKILSNLTALWYKYLMNQGKHILDKYHSSIGSEKHHKFIAHTRFLGIAGLTWTHIYTNSNGSSYSLILMVTLSSHLAVWKIPQFSRHSFEPSIVDCLQLDESFGKVTVVYWYSLSENGGFLVIGSVTGEIILFYLTMTENKVSLSYMVEFENLVEGMSVNHVYLQPYPENENYYILFAAKHNILFVFLLYATPSEVLVLSNAHRFAGTLAISGLNVISSTLVYISVKDGCITKFELETDHNCQSISFKNEEGLFKSSGVFYSGYCFSPNKVLWALLETVSIAYDHLLLREPTVISIFQINKFGTLSQDLISKERNLSECIDVFESLRLTYYRESNNSIPSIGLDEISSLSNSMKRTYVWLSNIYLASQSQEKQEEREAIKLLKDSLIENILRDYIYSIFSDLKEAPSDPQHSLSIQLMIKFLEQTNFTSSASKKIGKLLKKQKITGEETCLICKSSVDFTTIHSAICIQGHNIPRCPRSLVAVLPILKCPHCRLFYHTDASKWYGSDGSKCLICSRKMQLKVQIKRPVI